MTKPDINDIPELLKSKTITLSESVNFIWEDIYTKPYIYGLENMDEDQKSDFLLSIIEKFPVFIENYVFSSVTFTMFLKTCLNYYKLSWKRNKFERIIDEQGTDSIMKESSEYDTEKYDPFQNTWLKDEVNENLLISEDDSENQKKIKSVMMIALTLKACRDVDDSLIKKVSKTSGISEEKLQKMIQSLKETMSENDESRDKLIAKRNNAFFYHRRYNMELNRISSNSDYQAQIRRKFNFQTRMWIKSNEILNNRVRNSPSNKEIAKRLGLKPRTVAFYINQAKKIVEDEKPVSETTEKGDFVD